MIDELDQPQRQDLELTAVLAAMADPGRLATLRTLAATGEVSCGQLLEASGLECTKSTMSHHLRVLREAGLTRTRVVGARRYVSLRGQDLETRFPGLLVAVLSA